MTGEITIERPQTETEKKDFILVGTPTIYDLFSQKLSEKVLEFNKKYLPFDEPCARLDFRDKVEKAERESERAFGFVKQENLRVDIGDLDKYGKADRFELIEDQEAVQDKVIEGMRTQVVMGHTLSYRCKDRNHGISLFIPNDVYASRKEKK